MHMCVSEVVYICMYKSWFSVVLNVIFVLGYYIAEISKILFMFLLKEIFELWKLRFVLQ